MTSIFPYPDGQDRRNQLRVRVNDTFELDMFSDGQINFGIRGTAGATRDSKEIYVDDPWITAHKDDIPDLIVALTYFLENHVRHDV